jgi:hypothetical protein
MPNDLITTSSDFKPKSFWNRPEGTTGMVALGLIGVGGFFLAKYLLPSILDVLDMGISAVGKTITLTVLGAVAFARFYVITNKGFQSIVKSMFKSGMRAMTGMFVEIDPIGIMRNYIDTLKDKKRVMDANVTSLNSQISVISQKIEKNKQGYNNAMSTAKEAQARGMQMQFTLQARSAGRLEKSTVTYQQMLDKMTILYRALKKYQEAVTVTIADLTEEVNVKSEERSAIIAASKAMKGAMAILMGSGPEKELFDQAMEFTVQDYGQRIGEIDDFMDTTKSILEGIDLQNGVYDSAALEKLSAWESKADSLVLGGEKRLMMENASMNLNSTSWGSSGAKVPVQNSGEDFTKFFNK